MSTTNIMDRGGDRGLPDRGNVVGQFNQGAGNIGGSLADQQIAFGNGINTIAGSDDLKWLGNQLQLFGGGSGDLNIGAGAVDLVSDGSAHFANNAFNITPAGIIQDNNFATTSVDINARKLYELDGVTVALDWSSGLAGPVKALVFPTSDPHVVGAGYWVGTTFTKSVG